MADAIYMYITILEVRQWYLPENVSDCMPKYPRETGATGRKVILQPASRTGHGICQTFEPIPEVFGRMSVSFPK